MKALRFLFTNMTSVLITTAYNYCLHIVPVSIRAWRRRRSNSKWKRIRKWNQPDGYSTIRLVFNSICNELFTNLCVTGVARWSKIRNAVIYCMCEIIGVALSTCLRYTLDQVLRWLSIIMLTFDFRSFLLLFCGRRSYSLLVVMCVRPLLVHCLKGFLQCRMKIMLILLLLVNF